MKIVDVSVQNYRQPMVAIHRKRFEGDLEISLVTVRTDEGLEGYAMARAQGGTSGQAIGEYIVKSAKPRVMMKLVRTCETMHVGVASHHGGSPIMNFANLHCLCAMPSADFLEMLVPEESYDVGLREYLRIDEDGCVAVPTEPGLGVTIDWDYVDAHTTTRL